MNSLNFFFPPFLPRRLPFPFSFLESVFFMTRFLCKSFSHFFTPTRVFLPLFNPFIARDSLIFPLLSSWIEMHLALRPTLHIFLFSRACHFPGCFSFSCVSPFFFPPNGGVSFQESCPPVVSVDHSSYDSSFFPLNFSFHYPLSPDTCNFRLLLHPLWFSTPPPPLLYIRLPRSARLNRLSFLPTPSSLTENVPRKKFDPPFGAPSLPFNLYLHIFSLSTDFLFLLGPKEEDWL